MRKYFVMLSLLFVFFGVAYGQDGASVANEDSYPTKLPTPDGLARDVRFWEKIFKDYGAHFDSYLV